MAEDAFGESGTGYNRQEPSVVCGSEISQRLMAHMLGLEGGVDPLSSYYLLHSRVPFDSSQAQPLSYPLSAEFTSGMPAMNPAVMPGDGTGAGGNWSHNVAAPDIYGINNANYMYDFGEYGV